MIAMWIKYVKKDDGIILAGLYGDSPIVTVPADVQGIPVIGLYKYCFSDKDADDWDTAVEYRDLENPQNKAQALGQEINRGITRALSGDFVTEIMLPDSLKSIGDLCFYGCSKLRSIRLDPIDMEIGSDAFMNCKNLNRFNLNCSFLEKTSLRRILLQRTEATYVTFDDASAYFPEYTERYDLIGPAHIFELKVDGEGLRARQCFDEDVFLPRMYDEVFKQAITSEDEKTLCRMAASRLEVPTALSDDAAAIYTDYIKQHVDIFVSDAVKKRDLTIVTGLIAHGVLDKNDVKKCLVYSTREGWTEGTRVLLGMMRSGE